MPGYGPPTPVPIYQWEQEFNALLELFREHDPASVLEVGSYHGGTLYHWLLNITPPAVVVAVDSYAVGVDNRHLYPDWTPDGVDLHVVVGDSRDPKVIEQAHEHGPYEWAFIDAGHYYHEVKADWENYRGMVASGGVCCFHDILPPSAEHPEIEVAWLWQEIKDAGYSTREIVANSEASWGGIGVVSL
jgi:cephalosporin hydroxylase